MFDNDNESAWHDVESECSEGWMLTVGGVIAVWLCLVASAVGIAVIWRNW